MIGNSTSHVDSKTKCRSLSNLQNRRFWVESENRWVSLRASDAGLRLVDRKGTDEVPVNLRARGKT